jgi:hypothetical protein
MEFNLNIEVLDGFVPSNTPAGNSLKYFIIYGFLAGIALWFLVKIFL